MAQLVYPGSLHTRFHHALGASYLLTQAVENLRVKGIVISEEEEEAATLAVLLHDVGHSPFSHSLEGELIQNVGHEELSCLIMARLNQQYEGRLNLALDIFTNKYPRPFLHELVSSQLDVDRLDYLRRDSFYTGVTEGSIGSDRIIKMLHVKDDKLVVEAKAIYSIEKFLLSRRLMYWQVYLHKTVVSAEQILIRIIRRARWLSLSGVKLHASPPLLYFLNNNPGKEDLDDEGLLLNYLLLDDSDILSATKCWQFEDDPILARLSGMLINRQLLGVKILNSPPGEEILQALKAATAKEFGISQDDASYFVFCDKVENSTYSNDSVNINILTKDGRLLDLAEASDQFDLSTLSRRVTKYFLLYPKQFSAIF